MMLSRVIKFLLDVVYLLSQSFKVVFVAHLVVFELPKILDVLQRILTLAIVTFLFRFSFSYLHFNFVENVYLLDGDGAHLYFF